MAKMDVGKEPKPIEIDEFFGINEAVGETQIKSGEWVKGFNFRITKNMKAQKRPGHHTFIDFEAAGDGQGLWEGTLDGTNMMLVCWNGNVYEYDMSISTTKTLLSELITDGVVTIVGAITDVKTDIFWFNSKVYFLNGTDYKEYDGTTYQDVTPYVPTIALNAPPAGGGTLFEEINLLTGAKIQTFIGDGASTLYQLAESGLDADLLIITVDGVSLTEGVNFTVNRTLGQVTFSVAPINLAYVSIQWVKVNAGNSDLVKNHKFAVQFGVNNDTNLFIFGNVNEKHVFRFSGINKAGYFPANSFVGVGSDEFAITSLQPQYQSLLVYKKNSTKIVDPTSNPNFADNTGLNPYNFGYRALNDSIGNLAPNMVQLVTDKPVSLDGVSMRLWASTTSVRDEREPEIISDRLKLSLQVLNLATAVTFDYEFQKELWVNVDDIVYIWNYGNNTMYKYSNIKATEFIDVEGDIYYTANGTVEHINENFLADGTVLGDTIPCKIYGGFSDFDSLEWRKMMRDEWLAIAADSRTSCTIGFLTDKINEEDVKFKTVEYKTMDFDNIDFNDFSFLTNLNPQPNRLKLKVKKWTYIQWLMENDTNNETLTILKLLMKAQLQGHSK
jgi:hypothetical protein